MERARHAIEREGTGKRSREKSCYSHRWKRQSKAWRAEFPTCPECGRATTEVHHLVPPRYDPTREVDPTNCAPCCGDCHEAAHFMGLKLKTVAELHAEGKGGHPGV